MQLAQEVDGASEDGAVENELVVAIGEGESLVRSALCEVRQSI